MMLLRYSTAPFLVLLASVLYVTASPTSTTSVAAPSKPKLACRNAPQPSAAMKLAHGYEGTVALGGLSNPRGIALDRKGNLLVVERGKGITGHFVDKESGCVVKSKVVVDDINLNHGIDVSKEGNKLFATSREFAWSWDYNPVTMTASNRRTHVTGMTSDKQLTRTILASKVNPNIIVISTPSGDGPDWASFDPAVGRAQVRAFDWTKLPPGGVPYNSTYGKVLGYGLVNSVGIAEDRQGFIHAGDTGTGTGRLLNGTMTSTGEDNPAEAFFKLSHPLRPQSLFNGYPYCFPTWTLDTIEAVPERIRRGDWLSSLPETEKNDAWCAEATNGPAFILPPHITPLDFKFGVGEDTNVYIPMHGNGFFDPSKGFKVVSVDGRYAQGGWATRESRIDPSFKEIMSNDVESQDQCLQGRCFRPLGIVWHPEGKIFYVSSDNTGEVFLLKKTPIQTLGGQCGGLLYRGPTLCEEGAKCQYRNILYSQCVTA